MEALDFDLACSLRLLTFENQRELDRAKIFKSMMIEAISEALMGPPKDGEPGPAVPQISEDDVL